jgi:hypothetical protein
MNGSVTGILKKVLRDYMDVTFDKQVKKYILEINTVIHHSLVLPYNFVFQKY